MAQEEQHLGYYDSILQGKSYIDDRTQIQFTILSYISTVFFGQDLSRVVYTNPEYAFRKRLEGLGKGIDMENLSLTNLQLPFASFSLTNAPEIIKSVSASEWNGYYIEELGHRLFFSNEVYKSSVQFWFHRSDDAAVAFRIAQSEKHSDYPFKAIQTVYWRNKELQIPVFITIRNITAGNENFNETEWLNKNHIFAMKLELEIETASIHIHRGLQAIQLPYKWRATGPQDTWKDGDKEYFTQKCILMWSEKAWNFNNCPPEKPTQEALDVADLVKDVQLKKADEKTIKQIQSVVPNGATVELVEGYFRDLNKISFNRLMYNKDKTTIDEKGEVTAWIDFVLKPSSFEFWESTKVFIPSRKNGEVVYIKSCKDKFVQLDGLHPNSTYKVYFVSRDIEGNFNTVTLDFTTPSWEKEVLPDFTSKEPDGIVAPQAPSNEPKVIQARGLIGLEL